MYVYILANDSNVCLYIGVTNDLERRLYEHREKMAPKSFAAVYNVHKLVYFEETPDPLAAIAREKQLKGWNRKKNKLIESVNPQWRDLSAAWSE